MSVENKQLQERQNTPEIKESYNYQEAIEMTKKIHDGMDKNGYNHEQYGINPKTGIVFSNDGKIKILINEKSQPIETGFTVNDYTTNRYGSFTIFEISKRIRELEKQHAGDIENLAGTERKEIINSTKNSLNNFINETLEFGNLAITGLIHKTRSKISNIMDGNQEPIKQQEPVKNQVMEAKKIDTIQTKVPQSTSTQNMYNGFAFGPKSFQFKQPEQVKQKPNQAGHILGIY